MLNQIKTQTMLSKIINVTNLLLECQHYEILLITR